MFKEKRAGNDLELLHNYSRGLNLRNMNIGFPITPKNFIYDQDIDRNFDNSFFCNNIHKILLLTRK